MSSLTQKKRMASSQSVKLGVAGSADPGAVAECREQEQELSETFQPTGEMIATYSKRVTLSKLTLEAYIKVFDLLTKGIGNLVQPNLEAEQFTLNDLRQVTKLSNIRLKRSRTKIRTELQESILEGLVGMEILDPRSIATQGSVPHALTEEEMQEDLLALQWQD